jgi:transcription-repair coupling factor (superfamily II helicase)
MRASFISALSEKQVIVIVPSTVLCEQHFNSFIKRFINYPVNIKKLNRFVSTKEREIVIDEFNEKKIDILISTHVVFNNNINFKNTGLLVIDEEHKFGIKQKNYIKDKQANIHILYLSATPIPRTMNLVYSGLKDFSFLHTAPSNRISIKSFLKLHTSQILKEALSREKNRGGQCFIVQNDISKMASIKKEINNILPNFKVGTAHGKLSKKDINMVMNDFKNGNIDGLICTTIVEMGLDIPNANTMIITNSHNFGLSQLHQLRGRVGRSDKQGYCYFLIPTMDIPNISRNRLDAVIKHSKLGEGFLIAQEDLEIRGGGEMLGDKQSGHVNDVGISLYLSMLKEAIKGTDDIYSNNNLEINFNDSSFIDDNYLPSPIERLKIYSQISQSSSFEELEELNKNLIDRCGKMPPETLNLINNKFIGLRIKDTGIKSIKSNEKSTNIQLESNAKKDIINNMINLASSSPEIYSITKDNKFIFKSNDIKSELRRKNVNLLLDEIL